MNKLVFHGGHDCILSIGQVVPHEVIGMANYNKNIFVGTGGRDGINVSHFIGAVYGMERMMGRAVTPLRLILNRAQDDFCQHLPLVYFHTVVGLQPDGRSVLRAIVVGNHHDCFFEAAKISQKVNVQLVDEAPEKVVAWLDPEEFHSTWVGNKAIYRTRMMIADGGELIVLAPGVKKFGEFPRIDELIRQFGYRTTPEILQFVNENAALQQNLSAAAHLIHGSSENRFRITYAPLSLTRDEVTSVGYEFGDFHELVAQYRAPDLRDGWNTDRDGNRFYFVGKPALGLWATRDRFQ